MFGLIKDLMWPKQGSFITEEGDRYTGGLDISTPIGFGGKRRGLAESAPRV
tara:strand:- start:40 stop:192 length:153 start_codon:yes stop_codon:yes gene_type:complete